MSSIAWLITIVFLHSKADLIEKWNFNDDASSGNLPFGITDACIISIDDKYKNEGTIYIFGGKSNQQTLNRIYQWTPSLSTNFQEIAPSQSTISPSPFICNQNIAYNTNNNQIYISGVQETSNNDGNIIYIFDPNINDYVSNMNIPSIPTPVESSCIAMDNTNNLLYIMGGYNQYPLTTNILQILDLNTNKWLESIATAPINIASSGCWISPYTQSFYVFGGKYNDNNDIEISLTDSIFKYKLTDNTWQLIGQLTQQKCGIRVIETDNDKLLLIGGETMHGFSNKIEVFDILNPGNSILDKSIDGNINGHLMAIKKDSSVLIWGLMNNDGEYITNYIFSNKITNSSTSYSTPSPITMINGDNGRNEDIENGLNDTGYDGISFNMYFIALIGGLMLIIFVFCIAMLICCCLIKTNKHLNELVQKDIESINEIEIQKQRRYDRYNKRKKNKFKHKQFEDIEDDALRIIIPNDMGNMHETPSNDTNITTGTDGFNIKYDENIQKMSCDSVGLQHIELPPQPQININTMNDVEIEEEGSDDDDDEVLNVGMTPIEGIYRYNNNGNLLERYDEEKEKQKVLVSTDDNNNNKGNGTNEETANIKEDEFVVKGLSYDENDDYKQKEDDMDNGGDKLVLPKLATQNGINCVIIKDKLINLEVVETGNIMDDEFIVHSDCDEEMDGIQQTFGLNISDDEFIVDGDSVDLLHDDDNDIFNDNVSGQETVGQFVGNDLNEIDVKQEEKASVDDNDNDCDIIQVLYNDYMNLYGYGPREARHLVAFGKKNGIKIKFIDAREIIRMKMKKLSVDGLREIVEESLNSDILSGYSVSEIQYEGIRMKHRKNKSMISPLTKQWIGIDLSINNYNDGVGFKETEINENNNNYNDNISR